MLAVQYFDIQRKRIWTTVDTSLNLTSDSELSHNCSIISTNRVSLKTWKSSDNWCQILDYSNSIKWTCAEAFKLKGILKTIKSWLWTCVLCITQSDKKGDPAAVVTALVGCNHTNGDDKKRVLVEDILRKILWLNFQKEPLLKILWVKLIYCLKINFSLLHTDR